jgi:hypothetical protein
MMSPDEFDEAVSMLRSSDPMTYEDGYHWLQGANLLQYVDKIASLLNDERDPRMRAKFVELIGDADLPQYIPLLVEELSDNAREVRFWAYNQLSLSVHALAKDHAARSRNSPT